MSEQQKKPAQPNLVGPIKAAMERAVALKALEDSMPDQEHVAELTARIRRLHFDAHVRAGFTEAQALELCKKTSLV